MTSQLSRVKDKGRRLPATNHYTTCLQDHLAIEKLKYRVRFLFCKTLRLPTLVAWIPTVKHDVAKLC